MGVWFVDNSGENTFADSRLGGGENNEFRIGFTNIDHKDTPF